jgi:N-acetylneuraminic acid mutarotase
MRVSVMRSVMMRFVPALVTFGLVLVGCDGQEDPVSPLTAEHNMSDKERNAVDLGPAPTLVRSSIGTSSVLAFGSTVSIPFAPEPGPFANSGPACDDCVFNGRPIGFSFTFFGNTYTTFNLSSNGFIGFGASTDAGCCSGRPIPSNDGINNIIAAAWTDLYPGGGGLVSYETRGRAPSRYLVVNYQDIPWCCEVGTSRVTTQIILYESTNRIEIHTTNQSGGHIYTQGVEDANGSQAVFIPGRVATNFGLINIAVRFTTETSWLSRTPLPSARRGLSAAAANGLLYAIGGTNSAGTALTSVQGYNPSTNSWTSRASLPAARQAGNSAVTINGIIYLPGGNDAGGTLTRTLYAYNTGTNTWSTKATMPAYSSCGGAATYSGKLYVFSGCTRSSTGAQVPAAFLHRYDPSNNTWTTLRSAPASHFQPVVGVINGKLYVVGGNNASGAATGRVDMYDPATNLWSTRSTMPTPRVTAAAVTIGGKLHVIGGRNGTTYLNSVQAYDPATNSWTTGGSMPTARAALGAASIGGLMYAVGGRNSTSALIANERYTP